MEMKISTYTAILAVFLTLASCTQDVPDDSRPTAKGEWIFFRSHLPGIAQTRAAVTSNDNLMECRATCINPDDPELIDSNSGNMKPYFSDMRFEKDDEGHFVAMESDSSIWPRTNDRLHFFAYNPSAEAMRENFDETKFNLANYSNAKDKASTIDYRLERFQVANEIADQVDFIAAYSDGTQLANGSTGIELNFRHWLARIELMAWSESIRYGIEIAGVRIGNALTEGDFSFSSLMSSPELTGAWSNTAGHQPGVQHIFGEGERIVELSRTPGSHTDKEHAASIMGASGSAMVIPMAKRIEAWGGLKDPGTGTDSYLTDKLYFSILLRVKNWADEVVYPYQYGQYDIPAIYLAVDNDGTICRRVYRIDGEYYTTEEKSDESRYEETETEEIRDYCWAAIPFAAKWEPGKIYTYKLNYTDGIGWHDPSYPSPGQPIIDDRIVINVEVSDWKDGTKPEVNDVTVPRK